MKALLTLEKHSRGGELLERRVQWSRSFTQNFMELLYVEHAYLQNTAPRTIKDITGGNRNIDNQVSGDYNRRQQGPNLLVAAPCGGSAVPVSTKFKHPTGGVGEIGSNGLLPAEIIGIQVGAGNTAVTPQDYRLENRIGHGNHGAVGVAASFLLLDYGANILSNPSVVGYIQPPRKFLCTGIRFQMWRSGLPGTLTLRVHNAYYSGRTTSSTLPVGGITELISATFNGDTLGEVDGGVWYEFTFATPLPMEPGVVYRLYISKSGAGNVFFRADSNESTNRYYPWYGGLWGGGSIQMFNMDLRGTTLAELNYGGCDIIHYQIANPNASFDIRRIFNNYSGEDVTIEECGIYSTGGHYAHNPAVHCIARDVIAPAITLLDGQNLMVTYTPQITV